VVEALLIVILDLHGFEIITNGEEMILDFQISIGRNLIIIDGKLKMIINGDEILLIHQQKIDFELLVYEGNDLAIIDGMFLVLKIGNMLVIVYLD